MREAIKEIFEVKDVVWFILGWAAPSIWKKAAEAINSSRMKHKIKKDDLHFSDTGIVSLAHGAPFFVVNSECEELKLGVPEDIFHIAMPAEIQQQILAYNPQFDNTHWEETEKFFDGQSEQDMLQEISEIAGLRFDPANKNNEINQIFEKAKITVAELLCKKVKSGEAFFNGEKYGIKRLQQIRDGSSEKAEVEIQSFKSDYYTHQVMETVYKSLYAQHPDIMPGNDMQKYNRMRYFLTCMGMNVLLILKDENVIVFAKRSGKLINMDKPLWHDSMNEGISITDISDISQSISLRECIVRGLDEELGISVEQTQAMRIHYSDVFCTKCPFETGIAAFVEIEHLSFSRLKIAYSAAKDKELETEDIMAVPFSENKLREFMNHYEMTEVAKYMIQMLLARKLKNAI